MLGAPLNIKHPSAKGLIGCWLINENSGDVVFDSSYEKHHGTNIGAGWVPLGLYFDGTDRVQLPGSIINNSDGFTINARFNGAAGGIVYAEGYTGNTNWALFIGIDPNPPYSARFFFKDNNVWKGITVGTTPVNDGWHTASISQLNKSYRTIYVDGVPEAVTTDTVGDMSTLNVANIGVLQRSAFGSYFIGDIEYVHVHDRGFTDSEIKLHNIDPHSMFKPVLLPQDFYSQLIFYDTGLLSGKLIIRDSSIILLDGKALIKDASTGLLDGKARIKDISTDLLDGKALIKDVATDLLDGKAQIKDTDTDILDGKAHVKDASTDILDGKARIEDVDTGLLDGKARIKDISTGILDGKARIEDVITGILDGKVSIKDAIINSVDGKIRIKDVTTPLIDGLIRIKNRITSLLDGKIEIGLGIPTRYRIEVSSEQQHSITLKDDEQQHTITVIKT